ncbi:MAG: XTP/dITP diphosphatase [Nitrospirota bacterium]|nr:XTP/dITP diphosphatase [Nitrospirota bacterium]
MSGPPAPPRGPVLVLATANPDKAREMAALLEGLPFDLKTRADFGPLPDVDETADTFAGNAILKAEALMEATGHMALADDSGLCVDALNGAPGVWSARFAGPGCTYADNNRKLLQNLAHVPDEQRTARFVCVVAIARPGAEPVTFEGTCEGMIARENHGEMGFGYDPLFVIPTDGRSFAQMTREEKAAHSHRARAFAKAGEWLEKYRPT